MKKYIVKLFNPDGSPRYMRIYDNGGDTADRYTIVFSRLRVGYCYYVGSSAYPYHPQGFYQHGESSTPIDYPSYSHLGKKITFNMLPVDVRRAVCEEYKIIWESL